MALLSTYVVVGAQEVLPHAYFSTAYSGSTYVHRRLRSRFRPILYLAFLNHLDAIICELSFRSLARSNGRQSTVSLLIFDVYSFTILGLDKFLNGRTLLLHAYSVHSCFLVSVF